MEVLAEQPCTTAAANTWEAAARFRDLGGVIGYVPGLACPMLLFRADGVPLAIMDQPATDAQQWRLVGRLFLESVLRREGPVHQAVRRLVPLSLAALAVVAHFAPPVDLFTP